MERKATTEFILNETTGTTLCDMLSAQSIRYWYSCPQRYCHFPLSLHENGPRSWLFHPHQHGLIPCSWACSDCWRNRCYARASYFWFDFRCSKRSLLQRSSNSFGCCGDFLHHPCRHTIHHRLVHLYQIYYWICRPNN